MAGVVVSSTTAAAAPALVRSNTSVGSSSTGTTAPTAATTPPRLPPTTRGPGTREQGLGGVQLPGPAKGAAARTASSRLLERRQQGGSVVLPSPARVANSTTDGRGQQSGDSVVRPPPASPPDGGGGFSGLARAPRTSLNNLCSNCHRNPGAGNKRKRLCPSAPGCPRWICRDTCHRTFNRDARFNKRVCCSCHPDIKEICQCRM